MQKEQYKAHLKRKKDKGFPTNSRHGREERILNTTTTTAPTETWHEDGFPFEELHQYPNLQSALAAGCKEENLWSICDGDDPDVWVYGPPHHYVNLLAVAHTAEAHDGRTYYVEDFNA